jgi:transcriptional regulator EpsA
MRQPAYRTRNAGTVAPATAAASAPGNTWAACLSPAPAQTPADLVFRLSKDESARFLCVATASSAIKRHYDLFAWLNGGLQHFLPHQILICAWGDFARWDIKLDVMSPLPGVRTEQLARCDIHPLVRQCYAQWRVRGREPLMLDAAATAPLPKACPCPVHSALRGMGSIFVHAMRDKRSGNDSFYLALDTGSRGERAYDPRFASLASLLFCQIDVACRRVGALQDEEAAAQSRALRQLGLSKREREILDRVRQGMSNCDIAAALDISPFTVKNHVQRIFRKIGANNRTHAAAKYHQAAMDCGK